MPAQPYKAWRVTRCRRELLRETHACRGPVRQSLAYGGCSAAERMSKPDMVPQRLRCSPSRGSAHASWSSQSLAGMALGLACSEHGLSQCEWACISAPV